MSRDEIHQNENVAESLIDQAAQQQEPDISEDEIIDAVAANVLERFRPAFEKLAK